MRLMMITLVMICISALAHADDSKTYTMTITNLMDKELLAPVLVAPVHADEMIFIDNYVSPEAEHQILTGDPKKLKMIIGKYAVVGHGTDGPPGVLLAPGKSISITITAKASSRRHGQLLRVISMVAPTMTPDNFVTGTINLGSNLPQTLDRYDIGHNEGRKSTEHVSPGAALIVIEEMM